MIKKMKLTNQKAQFIKHRVFLSFIITLVLIVLLFFIYFFIQSAKNQSETAAIMATRENINTKKDREPSPVPIVEITEAYDSDTSGQTDESNN